MTVDQQQQQQQRHRHQQQQQQQPHQQHHQQQTPRSRRRHHRHIAIIRSMRIPRRMTRGRSTSILILGGLVLVLFSVVERQQQPPLPTLTKYHAAIVVDPVVPDGEFDSISNSSSNNNDDNSSSKRKSIEEEKRTVNQQLLDLIRDAAAAASKGTSTNKKPKTGEKTPVNIVWQLQGGNLFGFGTTSIWITIMKLFFGEIFDLREFVIDQSRMDKYRFNSTHGLFSGFFEPTKGMYKVVDGITSTNSSSNNKWPSSSGIYYYEEQNIGGDDGSSDSSSTTTKTNTVTTTTTTLVTGQLNRREYRELRKLAMQYYGPDKSRLKKLALYGKVSSEICHLLGRLTKETQQLVQEIWKDSNEKHWPTISNIISSGGGDDHYSSNKRRSVAFHIRRGDKSIEIPLTKASTYVSKMMKVVDKPHNVQDCFVATDSYHAAIELEHALQSQNMTCHLSSLVQPNYKTTRGKQDFLGFLAEYLILTKATYFVGTFTSNVGDLVALTRRCEQQRQQKQVGDDGRDDDDDEMKSVLTKYNHYSQSYGVDMDEWDMIEFYINHKNKETNKI